MLLYLGVYDVSSCLIWYLPESYTSSNSDLSTSISLIKNKIKNVLLSTQKLDPLETLIGQSRSMEWYPDNFFQAHYPA